MSPNTEPKVSLESRVAEVLSKFGEAAAVDIAEVLYPGDPQIRAKTSAISVTLKRL